MNRGMSAAATAASAAEVVMRTAAVELQFPTAPVRLNGSPLPIVINGVEFVGVGGLGAITTAEESAELRAYNLSVSLSGIPRDAIAATLTEAYQNRPATVWEVMLNRDTGQAISDPIVVFRGRMDQMDVRMGDTATVIVRLENRLADWERPRLARYTTEDQQRQHPGDKGFDFVTTTANKEIVWPSASFTQPAAAPKKKKSFFGLF